MCMSKPKAPPQTPIPPPPPGAPEVDQQIIDERDRNRRRMQGRGGRRSTILAGDTMGAPTSQSRTLLGG